MEKQLSRRILKRRIIAGAVAVLFLALFIVCYCLREASKEVIVHEGYLFIPSWEEVKYNNQYIPWIVIGIYGTVMAGIWLLCDIVSCKFRTVEKDQHYITLYRGMVHSVVYIDAEEKGRLGAFSRAKVVEAKLPNNVKITVSFSRNIFYIAHISFSDDTRSIEL